MQQAIDAAVLHDLAPNGVLRAAINFGNSVLAQRDAATGEARGVSVDLTHELARRLGVVPHLVRFDAAGEVVEAVKEAAWDVAFLAVDPTRGAEVLFTTPYVLIEGAYIVRDDSEAERQSGVAEQTPQTAPIKAQSTAIARAMASICNAEWGRLRGMSGHVGLPLSLSALAIDEVRANGFVADALARSGQRDAAVAPARTA